MNGWVKHFADGTTEVGTDYNVQTKKASWSRGRLTGMVGAEIIHGNKRLAIWMPGTFWQSDDYEVNFLESTTKIVTRRLQWQFKKQDTFRVFEDQDSIEIRIPFYTMGQSLKGKWLTVELDVQSGKLEHSIRENRV